MLNRCLSFLELKGEGKDRKRGSTCRPFKCFTGNLQVSVRQMWGKGSLIWFWFVIKAGYSIFVNWKVTLGQKYLRRWEKRSCCTDDSVSGTFSEQEGREYRCHSKQIWEFGGGENKRSSYLVNCIFSVEYQMKLVRMKEEGMCKIWDQRKSVIIAEACS